MRYNTKTGDYTDDRGQKVSKAQILKLTEKEQRILERKLDRTTQNLINNRIDAFEWERQVQQDLKQSHLKMVALGAGGKDNITPRHRGQVGAALRQEYNRLFDFRKQIQAGEISDKQMLWRTKSYARSIKQSYYRSEQLTRAQNGATLAKRTLDVNAKHCPECPTYATKGFVPIEQVVPPGVRCSCRGNCKCTVVYRGSAR